MKYELPMEEYLKKLEELEFLRSESKKLSDFLLKHFESDIKDGSVTDNAISILRYQFPESARDDEYCPNDDYRPCPLCGDETVLRHSFITRSSGTHSPYRVECENCGYVGPEQYDMDDAWKSHKERYETGKEDNVPTCSGQWIKGW